MSNPFIPKPATIKEIKSEAPNVSTFSMAFNSPDTQKNYRFEPGQYNMVSLPGIGEAPISISSSSENRNTFDHTVRFVGRVTTALSNLNVGDIVGVRGPYGHPWPLDRLLGKHIVVMIGGTGCACVKPAIDILVQNRNRFKSAVVLYGAKNAQEFLFVDEFDAWRRRGVDIHLTVDQGRKSDWPFHTGVITTLFDRLKTRGDDSRVLIAGPDIMMRFCILDLTKRGWKPKNIWLSLERRMDCAIRMCGHCQIGPKYVCQDGPVFNYSEVEKIFGVTA